MAFAMPADALPTKSSSFQVFATIVTGCEINGSLPTGSPSGGNQTIGTLDFGPHSALSTETVSASLALNAGFTLTCTPGVSLTMSLDGGLHSTSTRNLQAADGGVLPYRLYADANHQQALAVGQSIPISFSGPAPIALPVYGAVSLPGNSRAGTYTDTIVVTLNW